jgi:hypothetical protein
MAADSGRRRRSRRRKRAWWGSGRLGGPGRHFIMVRLISAVILRVSLQVDYLSQYYDLAYRLE